MDSGDIINIWIAYTLLRERHVAYLCTNCVKRFLQSDDTVYIDFIKLI